MKTRSAMLMFVVFFLLAGCATMQDMKAQQATEVIYKGLRTSALLYQSSMKAIDELKGMGLLSESQVATTARLDQQFRRAYHAAVDAAMVYERVRITAVDDDVANRYAAILVMIDDLRRIALNLAGYAKPLLPE